MQPAQYARAKVHRRVVVDLRPQAAQKIVRITDVGTGTDQVFGVGQTRVDAFLTEHAAMLAAHS